MSGLIRYWVDLARYKAHEKAHEIQKAPATLEKHRIRAGISPLLDPIVPGTPVDLLRICAVHDRPWIARYISHPRGSYLAQTFPLTRSVYRHQYADNQNTGTVPSYCLEPESCPCCGACTPDGFIASVLCNLCGMYACYGLTVDTMFHCRRSCGLRNYIKPATLDETGIIPSWLR